jgi:catechol 2,3-dioxygenase-like lactoylglutathione lyase family enzyme
LQTALFILYVKDQKFSKMFYQDLLGIEPTLDVPGMTEFTLNNGAKLGLMPNEGIAKIISPPLPHPETGVGIPRCELYLFVDNPVKFIERAHQLRAKIVSDLHLRDWGDEVVYIADPDNHVIAFAKRP